MPGPAQRRLLSAVRENTSCEACHEEEAREWRGSYHQRSNVDPAYVQAFAIEPSPFCRSCHAPEADPMKEPPPEVSELGVGCVTCHVTEASIVLAAEKNDAVGGSSRAPHPVRRSKDFAGSGGCARCHEFRFPMPGGEGDAFFMQTTVREHERSKASRASCADCHMPLIDGRRSHSFDNVRDEAFLRKNLEVKAERGEGSTLVITLSQPRPGHDYPTGDLFRRIEVGAELKAADGEVLYTEARHLARHFEVVPRQAGRRLTHDDRVTSEPRAVEIRIPASSAPALRVSWWVTYQRPATVGTGQNPAEAQIESEVKLHSGSLPWPPITAETP